MSIMETLADVDNSFLSRREITCNFAGLAGKLKKLEAVDMITKEFKLDGKFVIPIKLENQIGKPLTTGTFYVYDDENLAKEHVNPKIYARFEKAKSASEQKEAEPAPEETETKVEGESAEKPEETKSEEKSPEEPKEEKSE